MAKKPTRQEIVGRLQELARQTKAIAEKVPTEELEIEFLQVSHQASKVAYQAQARAKEDE